MNGATNSKGNPLTLHDIPINMPGNTGTIKMERYGKQVIISGRSLGSTTAGDYPCTVPKMPAGMSAHEPIMSADGQQCVGVAYINSNTTNLVIRMVVTYSAGWFTIPYITNEGGD